MWTTERLRVWLASGPAGAVGGTDGLQRTERVYASCCRVCGNRDRGVVGLLYVRAGALLGSRVMFASLRTNVECLGIPGLLESTGTSGSVEVEHVAKVLP